ncbi:MAG: hypothetical protein OHK0040_01670 [bacterium]
MKDSIVEIVVNIEKELAELIAREKEKLFKTLEAEKSNCEKEIIQEEEQYKKEIESWIEDEVLKAEREGEDIIEGAKKTAKTLEGVSDEKLFNMAKKFVKKIQGNP